MPEYEESEGSGGSASSETALLQGRPHRVERPAASAEAADATGARKSAASEVIAGARAEAAERLLVEERERMEGELEVERAKCREREAAREEERRREREVRLAAATVKLRLSPKRTSSACYCTVL